MFDGLASGHCGVSQLRVESGRGDVCDKRILDKIMELFELDTVEISPPAAAALKANDLTSDHLLSRHQQGCVTLGGSAFLEGMR
jgi:hypothetical protein